MSTETTVASGLGESLSPAEQAYFSSKGADSSGLEAESTSEPSNGNGGEPYRTDAGPEPQQAAADESLDPGEVYLDENGKARSVVTGKFVPHGAFHKERERRKGAEAELQTTRERMARADERLAVLNEIIGAGESPQQQTAKQVEDETPPDPEVDIFGYVKWQQKKISELESDRVTQHQQREQARLASEVQSFYRNDAMAFVKQTPDFADAYSYVANSYASELRAKGYDDQQIRAQLMNEEAAIAYQAMQRRASPSQIIYDMAKARGWTGKGGSPQANAQPSAQNKIAAIQQGQRAGATLSGAGGGGAEGLTVEALANMSEEEFIAVSAKLGKTKMRQLLGG